MKSLFALLEEANHTNLRGCAGCGRCLITPDHRAASESGQQLNSQSAVYSTETYRLAHKTYPPSVGSKFPVSQPIEEPYRAVKIIIQIKLTSCEVKCHNKCGKQDKNPLPGELLCQSKYSARALPLIPANVLKVYSNTVLCTDTTGINEL